MQAWELFTSHPKLALIGGLTGQIQGGPGTGRFGKQRARHVRQIPYVDAAGRPFMFVSWVNMGPFLLKRRCAASPHSPAYRVSTTQLQGEWEGYLHVAASLTTLVLLTRSNWLRLAPERGALAAAVR